MTLSIKEFFNYKTKCPICERGLYTRLVKNNKLIYTNIISDQGNFSFVKSFRNDSYSKWKIVFDQKKNNVVYYRNDAKITFGDNVIFDNYIRILHSSFIDHSNIIRRCGQLHYHYEATITYKAITIYSIDMVREDYCHDDGNPFFLFFPKNKLSIMKFQSRSVMKDMEPETFKNLSYNDIIEKYNTIKTFI